MAIDWNKTFGYPTETEDEATRLRREEEEETQSQMDEEKKLQEADLPTPCWVGFDRSFPERVNEFETGGVRV
jgi:hypothetical protein